MMEKNQVCYENLKIILKNIRSPEVLNDHPWVRSLIVQEAITHDSHLALTSPGQQLVSAIVRLFPNMQPPAAPRRGKRLDPRWGEFGLLAALYFTPFNQGTAFPTSLLDAWDRIDPAILYQVYGKTAEELSDEQIKRYQLVGTEVEYGSASTLSDWHKKALLRLTDILINRERFLSESFSKASVILRANGSQSNLPQPFVPVLHLPSANTARVIRRSLRWLATLLMLASPCLSWAD